MLELPSRGKGREESLLNFAQELVKIQREIDFKVSARGWCYQLEQFGLITKAEFDRVENIINHDLRAKGYLPIDFVATEESRKFSGVETPHTETPSEFMKRFLEETLTCEDYYTPDWWDGEEFYIQMVVEKIDLKSLFEPVCRDFHIPIATSKGWSSMLQRAEYARRFKEAEDIARVERETAERKAALTGEPVVVPEAVEAPAGAPDRYHAEMGTLGKSLLHKWEVIDFALIPDDYKKIDAGAVTNVVKASKGKIVIPGIRVWSEETLRVNTR